MNRLTTSSQARAIQRMVVIIGALGAVACSTAGGSEPSGNSSAVQRPSVVAASNAKPVNGVESKSKCPFTAATLAIKKILLGDDKPEDQRRASTGS